MAPVRPFCVITMLLLVVLAVVPAQAQNGASLNGLDEFVNKAIQESGGAGTSDRDRLRRLQSPSQKLVLTPKP